MRVAGIHEECYVSKITQKNSLLDSMKPYRDIGTIERLASILHSSELYSRRIRDSTSSTRSVGRSAA